MIIRGMGALDRNVQPLPQSYAVKPSPVVTVVIPPPPGAPPSTPATSVALTGAMALTQIGQSVQQYQAATNIAVAKQAAVETKAATAKLDQAVHTLADQRDQAIAYATEAAGAAGGGWQKYALIGGLLGAAGLVAYLVMRRR